MSDDENLAAETVASTELIMDAASESLSDLPNPVSHQAPELVASEESVPKPVLSWFHVRTKSERDALAVRGCDADDAVAKFKRLRGIIDTPHAINAVKCVSFTPSASDLEHDAIVNPKA